MPLLVRSLFLSLVLATLPMGSIWSQEATTLKPAKVLEWRSELIRSLAFTSDGKQLVVSPKDNDCWAFDAATGAKLPEDLKGLRGPTLHLATGPRPRTIYCIEKIVNRLVDVTTGKDIATHGIAIDFSPSGGLSAKKDLLFLASASGGVGILKADLSEAPGNFEPTVDPPPPLAKDWRGTAAAYSADGKFVAGGRPNGRVYLWTTNKFQTADIKGVSAHTAKVDALAFTPAGLLSLGLDGKLKLWNPADAKELAAYSFDSQLDRGWLLCDGQIAAICRKPVVGELELHRVPQKEGDKLELVAKIPVVSLFDGFPTVHREFSVPNVALSPDWQRLAISAQSGSSGLSITQVAMYDVSAVMPKAPKQTAVASTESDPRVTGSSKPPTTKTTPPTKVEREFRTWATADGKFSVEAQFLSKTSEVVRLKRKDTGKVIAVPLTQLSAEDQAYAKGIR
ncbi:SHD1 domain-containing protein [Anatilimnocola sp. NA78]|uniref:SHD1 domain-containing protein n=1 Tax=Anatilimnocola sp. NA78 TaxID=3415683 RepID=UPI003CE596C7